MKKSTLLHLVLILFVTNVYSQANFLGFGQEQCGLVENPEYTFSNLQGLCSTHSSIYKIFYDGNLIYEKPCTYLGFYGVLELFFLNDSTGFLIEGTSGNIGVYKTSDYGKSWKYLGYGAPVFLGYYVVNEHNVYLITSTNQGGVLITKASDNKRKNPNDYFGFNIIENEAIINDTIYGDNFCDMDTLSFKVKDNADTISYKIAFQYEPLPTFSKYLLEPEYKIYPNPCSDYIYFSQNILDKGVECKLYSLDGRLVKSSVIIDNRMFIGNLKGGIYLMEIKIGDVKIKRKMVKQ